MGLLGKLSIQVVIEDSDPSTQLQSAATPLSRCS